MTSTSNTVIAEIKELLHIAQDYIEAANNDMHGFDDYTEQRYHEGREDAFLEVLEMLHKEQYG